MSLPENAEYAKILVSHIDNGFKRLNLMEKTLDAGGFTVADKQEMSEINAEFQQLTDKLLEACHVPSKELLKHNIQESPNQSTAWANRIQMEAAAPMNERSR